MSAVSRPRSLALATAGVSLALHGLAWASLSRIPPAPVRERIELEVVRRESPPSPAAPAPQERAARRVALAAAPPAAPPPLASAAQAPPSPGARRALPKVGISLGSTVAAGGFAVGVGNTTYGRAGETATDPASVRPYRGGPVPVARLSAQPRVLELPEIPYPPDARRDAVEGQVVLLLHVDARGAVASARVLDAPSPSLAAAAAEGARRFRFSPALCEGEPVETEIRFTYTFVLE